jgi:hypothetical protein
MMQMRSCGGRVSRGIKKSRQPTGRLHHHRADNPHTHPPPSHTMGRTNSPVIKCRCRQSGWPGGSRPWLAAAAGWR